MREPVTCSLIAQTLSPATGLRGAFLLSLSRGLHTSAAQHSLERELTSPEPSNGPTPATSGLTRPWWARVPGVAQETRLTGLLGTMKRKKV